MRDALPAGNDVLALCADLGSLVEITLLALVVALIATRAGRPELALLAVAAPLLGALVSTALKRVFDRYSGYSGEGLVYPSGHATVVTALAVVTGLLAGQLGRVALRRAVLVLLCAVPLATSAGLVTEQYHYASDTVGGMCLGIATALALEAVLVSRRASRAGSSAR